MAFTLKGYKKAQKSRATNKNANQLASSAVTPTPSAGAKNSNGPKGGSGKTGVVLNSKVRTSGETKPKAPKVTKATINNGVKKTPFNRSSRVNYRQLRRSK